MPRLHVALQEGFDNDTVSIRVNGAEVARRTNVTTRNQIGSADAVELEMPEGELELELRIEATKQLAPVLTTETQLSAETLGHIDYHEYVDRFAEWLVQEGDVRAATAAMDAMYKTLAKRGVRAPVLEAIAAQRDQYKRRSPKAARKP